MLQFTAKLVHLTWDIWKMETVGTDDAFLFQNVVWYLKKSEFSLSLAESLHSNTHYS